MVAGGSLGVSPVAAFPPGSAVSLDVTGTLDLLGRPFAMTLDLQPLVTTDVITDLTFDTAPPSGAVDSSADYVTTLGALVFNHGYQRSGRLDALVALPDPGAAAGARALLSWGSGYSGCESIAVAVVAADGTAERAAVVYPSTDPEPAEVTVALPVPGPCGSPVDRRADRAAAVAAAAVRGLARGGHPRVITWRRRRKGPSAPSSISQAPIGPDRPDPNRDCQLALPRARACAGVVAHRGRAAGDRAPF